jgi:hemerythrin-like domain-containing protein
MDPLVILREEHELLRRVLDSLDQCLLRVERGGSRRDLPRFVRWLRAFVETWHGQKEEDILFRAMKKEGFDTSSGPIAVVRCEHSEMRSGLDLAAAAVAEAKEGDLSSAHPALVALRSLGYLLRYHMEMEESVIYPMAEAELSPEAKREVWERMYAETRQSNQSPVAGAIHALAQEFLVLYPSAATRPFAA